MRYATVELDDRQMYLIMKALIKIASTAPVGSPIKAELERLHEHIAREQRKPR